MSKSVIRTRNSVKNSAKNTIIELPVPHKGGQRSIYAHPARFQVVACGRRFGKTKLGIILAARTLITKPGSHVAWVSPIAKMASKEWRFIKEPFLPVIEWVSEQEKTFILTNKSKMTFWSAENPDAMRGQAFDLVIMDEAAMYKEKEIWFASIQPALIDKQGRAYFLSTPKGRNWFYDLYEMGDKKSQKYNPEYQSWNFPSSSNPNLMPSEIELARITSPEIYFKQEYLAEFMVDASEVFKGTMDVATGRYLQPYPGSFVFGIDIARKNDWTVIAVFDSDTKVMVDMIRINNMDFPSQRQAIQELADLWKPEYILIESNNAGSPVIEELNREGLDVEAFYTTNTTKKEIIDDLSLAIQTKSIVLLNDLDLINEFQAYSMSRTAKGSISFSAPSGYHDDIVMATAIAYHAIDKGEASFGAGIPRIA